MKVNLTGPLHSLMEGAVQRARDFEINGETDKAARAYQDAALLATTYSENAVVPQTKQRYLELAQRYRTASVAAKSSRFNDKHKSNDKPGSTDKASRVRTASPDDQDSLTSQVMSMIDKSDVKWTEIAGLDELRDDIVFRLNLSLARRPPGVRIDEPTGILLYGPPGTGKTLVAAAVSNTVAGTFFKVSAGNILSKWYGESSKLLERLYEVARQMAPSVVFIDEIDKLVCGRGGDNRSDASAQFMGSLLAEMAGLHAKRSECPLVLTIGSTNEPWALDPALLSRFGEQVFIPPPNEQTRRQILELELPRRGFDVSSTDLDEMARLTNGWSGRDLSHLCRAAIQKMLRRANPDLKQVNRPLEDCQAYQLRTLPIRRDEWLGQIKKMPRCGSLDLQPYQTWQQGRA